MGDVMTDGYRTAAPVRRLGQEIPWTHPQRDPRLWWNKPEAWTPWNWQEATNQYQTFRKVKSQIR